MKNKNVRFITTAAMIAALYVVLVLAFAPISFGAIQARIAEALTILPYFTPAAIPGLTVGCLISNILGGADMLDIIFGTLATLIGAFGSYYIRKFKYLVWLPPFLANTIIVPWVLRIAYFAEDSIPYMMFTVGVGEILTCGILGTALLLVLSRVDVVKRAFAQ